MTRVVVWGTGNVGRPAIRAAAAHRELDLVGAIVSDPGKVGVDVGELAGIDSLGVVATDEVGLATSADVDCVIYAVNADFRPNESLDEAEAMLRAGTNVVTTAFYPMYHPPSMPPPMADRFGAACAEGNATIFASGIDPGWTCDILPLFLTGVSADISELRSQEIFN